MNYKKNVITFRLAIIEFVLMLTTLLLMLHSIDGVIRPSDHPSQSVGCYLEVSIRGVCLWMAIDNTSRQTIFTYDD